MGPLDHRFWLIFAVNLRPQSCPLPLSPGIPPGPGSRCSGRASSPFCALVILQAILGFPLGCAPPWGVHPLRVCTPLGCAPPSTRDNENSAVTSSLITLFTMVRMSRRQVPPLVIPKVFLRFFRFSVWRIPPRPESGGGNQSHGHSAVIRISEATHRSVRDRFSCGFGLTTNAHRTQQVRLSRVRCAFFSAGQGRPGLGYIIYIDLVCVCPAQPRT